MKKLYTLLAALVITASTLGQAPEKISYQAIVRNSSDVILVNQSVGIQISILQGSTSGSSVYVETQTPSTNANGLLSIEIGNGNVTSGNFTTIDWSANTYFIKTEIDTAGGTNYTITDTSQLMSVPYALHAKTAESITGANTASGVEYGDIKTGIQSTDHNGWLLLDGRALSSLTSNQQSQAATLGLSGNLPDGRDKYLSYSPTGSSTFGNNTVSLSKENLPTDSFSGTTDYVYDNTSTITPGQFGIMRLSLVDENVTSDATDVPGASVEADLLQSPIDHRHDFSLQLNETQTAIDNKPATLNVRMFIYLGE